MEELKGEIRSLRKEISALREEVDELRRILFILSVTTALAEADHSITHRYLRRVIEQVEGASRDRLERGAAGPNVYRASGVGLRSDDR